MDCRLWTACLVAYRDRAAVPHSRQPPGSTVAFRHALIIDGQVAGTWRTANDQTGTTMTLTPGRRLTPRERRAVREAAARYGRFLGCEVCVRGNSPADLRGPPYDFRTWRV